MDRISIVFTYNSTNRNQVELWAANSFSLGLDEIITVNEGNAENIFLSGITNIQIMTYHQYSEPLVMAVGAHYAGCETIILCRNGDAMNESIVRKARKSGKCELACDGIMIMPSSSFPWHYDLETGFERGPSGKFIHLNWRVRNV
ncbi:TPA: hypothetical protein ACP41M_001068 [Klebsiella aerogenes]